MAQLKDTVIAGSLRATEGVYTNEIQCTKLKALTSASATTNYGVGTNGQILTSNGTNAYWSSDIPVSIFNSSSPGLVPQNNITNNTTSYFLCADGTWRIPTGSGSGSSSYNLPVASSDELGGIKIGYVANTTSTARNIGVQLSSYKAYVSVPIFTSTTTGLVPAPTSVSSSKFLCSTGSWETIDTSGSGSGSGTTSISAATESALGGIKLYASNENPSTGYKLLLNNDYKAYVVIPPAANGVQGLVSTVAQTFDGKKTFTDGAIIGNANSIGTNTETSYTLYGTGLLKGTSTTIRSDLLTICNKNASSSYITGQPYRWAIQLGATLIQSSQGNSCPAISLSEDSSGGLQIKASRILLTCNTYERYNEEGTYSSGDIVWFSAKYYKNNNGLNDYITNTTNWTEIPSIGSSIACDSAFIPFIDKKYSLGSSTNSWSALYLNGYKIQCTDNGLTITKV